MSPLEKVHPSPIAWRDQVLYFLLPDRFSDGKEDSKTLFERSNPAQFRASDKEKWMKDDTKFQGGTIEGIGSKLDYLNDLGVTTLWIGPIFQQRCDLETYHGYGIQNFLDVDTRFGTRQDLRNLVDAAHDRGMYIILDIIYNHMGNNWFYMDEATAEPREMLPYRFQPPHSVHGWHSSQGKSISEIKTLEDGIWPEEFQNFDWYTRAGQIVEWEPKPWEDPMHPDAEFRRGDFFDLKDLNLNKDEVLNTVIQVYQYWIAVSDCDGYRIDAVKHLPFEVSRHFCGAIREYAESIGKENFLLVGEVTGGASMIRNYMEIFGG
jgi:glycosidase